MIRKLASWFCSFTLSSVVFAAVTIAPPASRPAGVSAPPAAIAESAKLPIDSAVRTGRLKNGLTYYVRRNTRPEKRADLWLAVNAGSTLENDDQQGLAHLVEHMAFRGTKNFKKRELINFLERTGMKFGPDINAFTSFDETVYTLRIPTDDPETMRKSLLILSDWAHSVSFDDDDIDKERGVVIEEWRLGRGKEARMRDKQFPILFKGSRYAERLTIGKKEILEKAPHDTIRQFYRDWYRPDLMAVIAVGDFDPEKMEKAIRSQFSSRHNPAHPRPRTLYPVPDPDQILTPMSTDPEASWTRVAVYYKIQHEGRSTARDYRQHLVERLYHTMVNNRLDELRRNPDPPFLFAFSTSGSFVRTRDVLFQTASVQEARLATGLDALLVELARVDKHGFNPTELERSKKEMLRFYEQAYKERDKQDSGLFTDEILRAFLEGESMPGIEFELGLVQRFLPTITIDEVNHFARQSITERNRVILVNGPEKAAAMLPSEAKLREVFVAAQAKTLEPWVDRVRQDPLVPEPPKPGTIDEETTIPELGITRWRLSNGVVVLLKATDFKNDQVLLGGFSPGGSSLVPDSKFVSATTAGSVLSEGGLGKFDSIELAKALAGKIASAGANVGELEETAGGRASPQDLETMFQLLYLRFTAPRADPKAFESWKARTKASIENRMARPETVFGDKMQVTMSQGHFRRRPISLELLNEVDLATAEAVWRERFADAGNFTFGIVGAIKVDEIRPLVLRYLGGLPSNGRKESWKDIGARPPDGIVNFEVRKGLEPKSQVNIAFTGPASWTRESSHLMSSLGSAMRIRLREVLREDMGGVYGVGAFGNISRRPTEQYSFTISFGCAPERVAELQKATLDLIEAVKKDGFSDDIASKVREQETRDRETALRENGFWLSQMLEAARFGDDPKLLLRYDELVKSVTGEALRDAARKYFDPHRVVTGVLYPEVRTTPPATKQ